MKMRGKIVAILVSVTTAVFVADGIIERMAVLPEFLALEREKGWRNVRRVEHAIGQTVDHIARDARSYAAWDDTCRFIQTGNPEFIRSSVAPEIFRTLNLNFIHFYNAEGRLVWGEARDATSGAPMTIEGLPESGFPPGSPLVRHDSISHSVAGLLSVGDQLMVVASHPIVTSEGKGPIRGAVVFGHIFGDSDARRLQDQVGEDLAMVPLGEASDRCFGSCTAARTSATADPTSRVHFDESSADVLRVYVSLCDIAGEPLRWVRIDLQREITAAGRRALNAEQVWMLASSVLVLLAAYWSFGRFVVRPIQQLIQHVLWIRQSGDLTKRIGNRNADEVGTLATEFDRLLAQLARSRATRLRSEKRLRAVLEDQTELIRRFLPDGTTTFVNRAYARCVGKSADALIGQKDQLSVPEEDLPKIEAHLQVLRRGRPTAELEHRVVLPNGEVRWLHWTTRALLDRDGNVAELQSVGQDVTDQMLSAAAAASVEEGSAN